MAIATSFSSEKQVDDDLETYLLSIIFLLRTVASNYDAKETSACALVGGILGFQASPTTSR